MRPLLELAIIVLFVAGTYWHAREAHRHTHELACHVDHPLCQSYTGGDK